MTRLVKIALLTAAVATISGAREPATAHACSGRVCVPDRFLPVGGAVPANLPAFGWDPGWNWGFDEDGGTADRSTQPEQVTLRCTDAAGVARDVALRERPRPQGPFGALVPDAPLNVGDVCVLTTTSEPCAIEDLSGQPYFNDLTGRAELTIAAAAPLPTTLGKLITEDARVQTLLLSEDGGCDTRLDLCGIRIEAQLDAGTAPWKNLLAYETYVDGERWHPSHSANTPNVIGGSFVGRGVDVLFYGREGYVGPGRGRHTVFMRATLPGTELVLETAPVDVMLDCGDAPVDASVPVGDVDGSVTRADAGVSDSGAERAAMEEDSVDEDDGGCSVRSGRAASRAQWIAGALAVLGLLSHRRQRRR